MSIITTERQGPIAILRLNRPDLMNALGAPGDGEAIQAACAALNADLAVRCVILTGEGRAFSAGGDVKAMADPNGSFSGTGLKIRNHYRDNIHRAARALYGLDMPVIAAVNGAAIGLGCDVACMADIRIASDKAKFGVTFLKLGLVPGDGGSWLLPRVIGASRAAELFFTGDVIDAQTAADWGLVSRVVPHDTLLDEALALATKIAALPPHSLRLTKTLLRQGQNTSYDTALDMAAFAQVNAHATADYREGVAALIDKRPPDFKGE
ncbi:crotonase/enoyl-CoA hydratase family protein [Sphingomonas immobilis]|uniref:Crotonase/enoyl-CoA hydratase family protein n=1 Tax=Sphingomonas immobilis TaxID=3063997 RepID=A0ABT8ZXF8_9SPHN|nr:crotonase/enoyl-CoA hydratase family protein [Sphingomonas sp. CA1-15]MDO7842246.1 crotonase/enoyl-CoA hydratase family protein [Sphingomonas sp. CA1-15]